MRGGDLVTFGPSHTKNDHVGILCCRDLQNRVCRFAMFDKAFRFRCEFRA